MKILLTGALGFIGKNFIIHRPKEWQVVAFDIASDKKFENSIKNTKFFKVDLSAENQVKKIAKNFQTNFDICLHLAANGDPALSVSNPLWDLCSTTKTLINVCQNFK